MDTITTRELKERLDSLQGQEVTLLGWIRNHRKQKNMGFMDFFDGTCFKNPQVVYDNTLPDFETVQALRVGSAVPSRETAPRIIPCSPSATRSSTCGRSPTSAPAPAFSRRCSACAASPPWRSTAISRTGAMSTSTRP